jgi:hypothetical protein
MGVAGIAGLPVAEATGGQHEAKFRQVAGHVDLLCWPMVQPPAWERLAMGQAPAFGALRRWSSTRR